MYLEKISILNFKNIAKEEILFSPKINCMCGDNGEGKTNLLDAIYYLSMTKSFLASTDQFILRYGEEEMILFGSYIKDDGREEKISLCLKKAGEKTVKKNSKAYSKLSDHIGLIPIVVISPADSSLIESADERRRLLNVILSQTDKEYLRSIQSYNRAIKQRNKLLKNSNNLNEILLSTYDEILFKESISIYEKRRKLILKLSKLTHHYYNILSGGKEIVSMEYVSDLNKSPLKELFVKHFERDKLLGYTSVGIHRDDIGLSMKEHAIKKTASQGQQKTFLISLKLAQYSLMRDKCGFTPILLLDDLFGKLDGDRVSHLINMVSNDDFGQIFITDTNLERINRIVKTITQDYRFFDVKSGNFYNEKSRD